MPSDNERILAVEIRQEEHANRIEHLESKQALLHTDMNELKRILINIKWWLMGVGSVYVIEQIGLLEFLKKVLI